LQRLDLAPLESDALDALFRERLGESVARPTLAQITVASGGNPLFALELARGVLYGEIHPTAGEPLSVPGTLQQFVGDRLADLPPDVRELLFIAAAVPDPNLALLERFTGGPDSVSAAVAVAVAAGVVQVTDDSLRFTHPLFASTLYHAVPTARRQTLHRRLAPLVVGIGERARHLALGARGPDARVAAALDEAARATAARGAADAAADLHEEAYRLTPSSDADGLNRRRMEAAECHFAAGDLHRARQIMEETADALRGGPVRASVLRNLAKVRYRSDSCSVAAELLTRALTEAGDDRSLRAAIERDLAWAIVAEMSVLAAPLLRPAFEASGGRAGRLSVQTDPTLFRDPAAMVEQAVGFHALAPNIIVKFPTTTAGLAAMEEATYRGISVNATVSCSVAQALAAAEAVQRGIERREADGLSTGAMGPVITIMMGRVEDWLRLLVEREGIIIDPAALPWSGVAVLKRAYAAWQGRGFRARLLGAAIRHQLHWTELIGGDVVITMPSSWQKRFNASSVEVRPRIDEPVPYVDELRARFPDFVRAYEPDGLPPAMFDQWAPTVRTLRAFIASYHDVLHVVSDALLPDPDKGC